MSLWKEVDWRSTLAKGFDENNVRLSLLGDIVILKSLPNNHKGLSVFSEFPKHISEKLDFTRKRKC